ncbi:hypothetical protein E4U09_001595 [Claviceps aff. purpurea]|uniref:Uncharacterized protein n=1 Tax=Claviceps aff. purpurea TaxID=1967640 RepID=A0A9P7QJB3_9HYPO|nr:hypothetical protein E4U09_001595 [Claviceps aff. purpurea]
MAEYCVAYSVLALTVRSSRRRTASLQVQWSNVGMPGTRLRGTRGLMANEASCQGACGFDTMNTVSIHAQQALNGAIPPRHTFERTSSSRNIFSSMRDSRRCAAESRRASAASSIDSTKSNKDAKISKDPKDKKIKLPTAIMPTFRFVI